MVSSDSEYPSLPFLFTPRRAVRVDRSKSAVIGGRSTPTKLFCRRRPRGTLHPESNMGLDDRMRAKRQSLLRESNDAGLTASEVRFKYDDEDHASHAASVPPSSPRHRTPSGGCGNSSLASEALLQRQHSSSRQLFATRCWACNTALRNPGANYFACGACGALNGEEPPSSNSHPSARCGARIARRYGWVPLLATTAVGMWATAACAQRLLPRLIGPLSAWAPAMVRHIVLVTYLWLGVTFNFAATVLAGPGYIKAECCPLRMGVETAAAAATAADEGRASGAPAATAAGATPLVHDEEAAMLQPPTPTPNHAGQEYVEPDSELMTSMEVLERKSQQQQQQQQQQRARRSSSSAALAASLDRLRASAGEMPLRGWRLCCETGLSKPPRAEYCHECRCVVQRMEHHCPLLNTCIGFRNQHYAVRLFAFLCAMGAYLLLGTMRVLLLGGGDGARDGARDAAADAAATVADPAAAFAESTAMYAAAHSLSHAVLAIEHDEKAVLGALALVGGAAIAVAAPRLLSHIRHIRRGLTHAEARRGTASRDFDLGAKANFQAVFGRAAGTLGCVGLVLVHLLPLPWAAVGNGIKFASRSPARRV